MGVTLAFNITKSKAGQDRADRPRASAVVVGAVRRTPQKVLAA